MSGLSVNIDLAELPRALHPMCGLEFEEIFGHLVYHGMRELDWATDIHRTAIQDQTPQVLSGLRLLGAALRGFAKVGYRCFVPAVSDRLGVHANRLMFELNESNVRNDELGVWDLYMPPLPGARNDTPGVDLGSPLQRAARALIREERYKQAGHTFAMALVYAAGGDDDGGDEPLAQLEVWGGFTRIDAYGTIKNSDDLEAYFVQLRHRRLQELAMEERRLIGSPVPPLVATGRATNEDMCCCCWAIPTDEQIAANNVPHLFP